MQLLGVALSGADVLGSSLDSSGEERADFHVSIRPVSHRPLQLHSNPVGFELGSLVALPLLRGALFSRVELEIGEAFVGLNARQGGEVHGGIT